MAIYEYRCEGCGGSRELKRLITERDEVVSCEVCGAKMDRAWSPFGFAFKLRWAEDRKEHFARQFENRRCERPARYG